MAANGIVREALGDLDARIDAPAGFSRWSHERHGDARSPA